MIPSILNLVKIAKIILPKKISDVTKLPVMPGH